MNVSVEVFNGTHVLLTFDYSQGVSRDCQVVYYRVATQADSSVRIYIHYIRIYAMDIMYGVFIHYICI